MSRARISACLIVQDEERRLPAALASVRFCDEMVVVDGGSKDGTVAVARAAGATVIENPWPGFARQRNVAIAAASGDWVLEIDADERVSPQLRASIERFLSESLGGVDVAVFPLRHRFLGGKLGASAKYPSYRTRLFRRGAYEHDESRGVHEGIEPCERPVVLTGDLEHELADTLGEALRDAWRYARLESAHIGPPPSSRAYAFGVAVRPAAKLFYRLVLDGGWRDGWRGVVKVGLDAGSDALVWGLVLGAAVRNGPARHQRETGPGGAGGPAGAGSAAGRGGTSAPVDADGATIEGQTSQERNRPQPDRRHFGRRPAGPPKVVALAGRGAEQRARRWLGELAGGGVDAALVCAGRLRPDGRGDALSDLGSSDARSSFAEQIACQRVARLTPLRTMRALDVEMQIRTAHAVVPFGARARLLARLLPGALRPSIAGVDEGAEPAQALARLRAALPT